MPSKWYQPIQTGNKFGGGSRDWTDPFGGGTYPTEPWWSFISGAFNWSANQSQVKPPTDFNYEPTPANYKGYGFFKSPDLRNSSPVSTEITQTEGTFDPAQVEWLKRLHKANETSTSWEFQVKPALMAKYVQMGMSPLEIDAQLQKDETNINYDWSNPEDIVKRLNLLNQQIGFQQKSPQQQMAEAGDMSKKFIENRPISPEFERWANSFADMGADKATVDNIKKLANTPVSLGGGAYAAAIDLPETKQGLAYQYEQLRIKKGLAESVPLANEFPDWARGWATNGRSMDNPKDFSQFADAMKGNPEFMKVYNAKQAFMYQQNPELYPRYLQYIRETSNPDEKQWSFEDWVNNIPEAKAFQSAKEKERASPRYVNTPNWALAR